MRMASIVASEPEFKIATFQAEAALELLGDDDAVLCRGGEMGALGDPLGDRLDDRGVAVALDHRAEAVVEVPHSVAVDVVDDGPSPLVR